MKLLSFALIILLCTVPAQAGIDAIKISAAIEQNIAYLDYIVLVSGPASSVRIPIPLDSQIVYAKDAYGNLETEIVYDEINVSLPIQISTSEQRALTLKVKSYERISQKNSYDEFTWNVYLEEPTDFELVLLLPEKTQKVIGIEPREANEQTADRKAISWNLPEYSGGVFLVQYVPEKNSELMPIAILIVLASITAIGAYFTLIKHKTQRKESGPYKNKKEMIEKIDILNLKEKQVMQEVIEHGSIAQYEIKSRLNLTKSNLSKVVKNLEMKGLLKRERIGKINKLVPGEKFKEYK